eukprot:328550-Alexandrium_andersonii.AAC.1
MKLARRGRPNAFMMPRANVSRRISCAKCASASSSCKKWTTAMCLRTCGSTARHIPDQKELTQKQFAAL